jgi:hypothetical protein
MPIFTVPVRLQGIAYIETIGIKEAREMIAREFGTYDTPRIIEITNQLIPVAHNVALDPDLVGFGSPRRAFVFEQHPEHTDEDRAQAADLVRFFRQR